MQRDPIRQKIHDLLRQRGATMRDASLAIGRNRAYMHQFLERGVPKVLSWRDSETLAAWLGCGADELRHATVPARKPMKRRTRRYAPPQAPGAPLAGAPEMAVEAAAGGGALNGEHVVEIARWYLPEAMLRHEGGAEPENVRILRARGDSMEPAVHDGDRLLVDTSRRTPATGEMAVLWDGGGLVVKRVEIVPRIDPPRLRLISANSAYPPYTCLADEAHMVGTVLWVLRRV